jgi:RNAse (barnase) inhibitor barstar
MFSEYQTMNTDALVDILARETQKFTQLMAVKNYSQEYMECKEIIQMIQEVLERRKELSEDTKKDSARAPGSAS